MPIPFPCLAGRLRLSLFTLALVATPYAEARADASPSMSARFDGPSVPVQTLGARLAVGDLVFIRVSAKPFREVAAATGSWTNHVGIVVDLRGDDPMVAESTFPLSRITSLSHFVRRSEAGRVAVLQLRQPLAPEQARQIKVAAQQRLGIFYDTGFNISSKRQFCSRYVREVLEDATGVSVGEVETFSSLLTQRPEADLGFWRLWYFGRIPWGRETVTPAALLRSAALQPVFDGVVLGDISR